ncbi:MAG: hypothetical protein MZV63_04575 [Marinilabiliales bacterium]|nr:hypothetical protein [Marinilabiliales bacterium]
MAIIAFGIMALVGILTAIDGHQEYAHRAVHDDGGQLVLQSLSRSMRVTGWQQELPYEEPFKYHLP